MLIDIPKLISTLAIPATKLEIANNNSGGYSYKFWSCPFQDHENVYK